jgi:hypothetical protein
MDPVALRSHRHHRLHGGHHYGGRHSRFREPRSFAEALPCTGTITNELLEGFPYTGFQVTPQGGEPPYTFSIVHGELPPGVTLNDGMVSGIPIGVGTFGNIIIRVTDSLGTAFDLAAFTMHVEPLILDEDELALALETYGSTTVPVTLHLSPDFVAESGFSFAYVQPKARLTIRGASDTHRPKLPSIRCDAAKNLSFVNLDLGEDENFFPGSTSTSPVTSACAWALQSAGTADSIEFINCDFWGTQLQAAKTGSGWQNGDYTTPKVGTDSTGVDILDLSNQPQRVGLAGNWRNLTVRQCWFNSLQDAIRPTSIGTNVLIQDNYFDLILSDCFSTGANWVPVGNNQIHLEGNLMTRGLGYSGTGGVHPDFIQLSFSSNTTYHPDVLIRGNIIAQVHTSNGNATHHTKATNDTGSTADDRSAFTYMEYTDNLLLMEDAGQQAPSIADTINSYCARNRVLHLNPSKGFGGVTVSGPGVGNFGAVTNRPGSCSYDNVTESTLGSSVTLANTILTPPDASDPSSLARLYATHFHGPFDVDWNAFLGDGGRDRLAAMKAALISAYTVLDSSPLAYLNDAYDFTTQTQDRTATRVFYPLSEISNAQVGSVYTFAEWRKVIGGGPGQTIQVSSNVQYAIADSDQGANATDFVSEIGTVDDGQFVKLKVTAPASGGTTTSYRVTIGRQSFLGAVQTASIKQFTAATNAANTFSKISAAPLSEPNRRKLLMAVRCSFPTNASNQYMIGDTTTGKYIRFGLTTAGKLEIRVNNGQVDYTVPTSMGTLMRTYLFAMDLTQTDANKQFLFAYDGNQILASNLTKNSANLSGTAVFDPKQVFAGTTVFASMTNGSISTAVQAGGGLDFIWADWGDETYDLPSFSNPMLFDKFSPDKIGEDGSGPLDGQRPPKLFFCGEIVEPSETSGYVGFAAREVTPHAANLGLAARAPWAYTADLDHAIEPEATSDPTVNKGTATNSSNGVITLVRQQGSYAAGPGRSFVSEDYCPLSPEEAFRRR